MVLSEMNDLMLAHKHINMYQKSFIFGRLYDIRIDGYEIYIGGILY